MTQWIEHSGTTQRPPSGAASSSSAPPLALTIAAHPIVARIGERALLTDIANGCPIDLSRLSPVFQTADGAPVGPIDEPHVSRAPLRLTREPDGALTLLPPTKTAAVHVDGCPLRARITFGLEALRRGVVLDLAGSVLLLIHTHAAVDEPAPKHGIVGESAAIHQLRLEISRAAALSCPILIRGESGTGKELIARALHAASIRAARPYVALNMAALNPQTATAELFGHSRGSFTGAFKQHEGHFSDADGGTLFLDEIGEAPREVQAMLLRALESGEIQPLGGKSGRRVDVRLIAATDANLEKAVLRGDFRVSLLHRLAGYELRVPPLRLRRDDIPRLFLHLLEQSLRAFGLGSLAYDPPIRSDCFLPASLVADLLRHEWPGNVRELGNVARRMVGSLRAERPVTRLAELFGDVAADVAESPSPSAPRPVEARVDHAARTAGELSDDALIEAMQRNQWQINATARELGISRKALYARIAQSEQMRKARDVSPEELSRALERHGGDLAETARALRVSIRALQLRLRELRCAS